MNKHELAGEVAIEVAKQVTDPIRGLRDRLGLVVDHLERHVAMSTGPNPYPWRSLTTLRQDLGSAYLEVTRLARRLEDLCQVVEDTPVDAFDLAGAVDLGLRLGGFDRDAGIELLVDLGAVAPVRGSAGPLAIVVAQLLAACMRSARAVAGSSISVRVIGEGEVGLVIIADNGGGDARADALGDAAREIMSPWAGTVDATSSEGRGCAFELRLVIAG